MEVTAAYAKSNLAELLKAVENGETVQITRYSKLVATLVPATASESKPKLGTAPKSVKILDPHWAEPMTSAETDELIEKGVY